ncbi:MAG: preprotein translocase subunit SecG [Bacteroidetes bacterium]|nr:preprotein translocase subunit SecG [Rhodothermia bacterium]MCS7154514.1 preprotein translocase subunit SecG [Bacteroidota bacterium]MCX7906887.1 preprotein translocase subunit SecG [Bacteroidota bacterium]MDW8136834.1 preprotein translocase subunit SecG [Bacteroidota bacterium]MDW8285296.1 preprotein translocase subunit SecG [Bacteroidota bacterium]
MVAYYIVIGLITLIAVLLIPVVLLQSSKGEGLAGIAGGFSGAQILGVRRTADILSKTTTVLATIFLLLCLLANFLIDRRYTQSIIQQRATEQAPASAPLVPPGGTPANRPAPTR